MSGVIFKVDERILMILRFANTGRKKEREREREIFRTESTVQQSGVPYTHHTRPIKETVLIIGGLYSCRTE